MLSSTRILLWRILAIISLILGIIGLVLPVIPTVPFVILAAWAGSKGWPALEQWLVTHPIYGPHIRHWREHGAVPRYAKWLATVMMLISSVGLQFAPAPTWIRVGVPSCMFAVAVWLWRRPEPRRSR